MPPCRKKGWLDCIALAFSNASKGNSNETTRKMTTMIAKIINNFVLSI